MEGKLQNDQIINLHHIRSQPLPIDSKALVVCHPNRKYASFDLQFTKKDDAIKLKVLKELNHLFYAPNEICYALISSSLLDTLLDYLVDPQSDPVNRKLASVVVEQITTEKVGQERLAAKGRLPHLMNLLGCEVIQIKRSVFKAIHNFSVIKSNRAQLLKLGVLVILFQNLVPGYDFSVVETACLIFRNLLEENGIPITCLSYSAHELLMTVAETYPMEIEWNALDCLILMSQCSRSKVDMVKASVHVRMANLFLVHRHEPETVQRLFLILTNLGQNVEAKNYLVEADFVPIVLGFLNQYEPNPDLFLNTILLLTTLAEHQEGRKELRNHVDKIQPFGSELFYPDTWEFAVALMEVVMWDP
jgi:hypothetical protein